MTGRDMSTRPPSADWSTDFDHLDPRWAEDPYPIWDELLQKCPIAHTERFQGAYFPSRYEDVRAVAYDTEHFSSRRPVVREVRPPLGAGAEGIGNFHAVGKVNGALGVRCDSHA